MQYHHLLFLKWRLILYCLAKNVYSPLPESDLWPEGHFLDRFFFLGLININARRLAGKAALILLCIFM